MSMFNEVVDKCPQCASNGYMQIRQVVLGFGNFDLSHLKEIKARFDAGALDERDMEYLAELVAEGTMLCEGPHGWDGRSARECDAAWSVEPWKVAALRMVPHVHAEAFERLVSEGLLSGSEDRRR